MNTYDLFISYARKDDKPDSRVTELVEQIKRDFHKVAGRELRVFFDKDEIRGMDDWRHRILQGLKEAKLLLTFLSPNYIKSEYCEWEFEEYSKYEIHKNLVSEGVAPIYFIELDDEKKGDEQKTAKWVEEINRRNRFDLLPWFHEGEAALLEEGVRQQLEEIIKKITERIQRGELIENAKGNVDRFNIHFSGRAREIRLLKEAVIHQKVGVLTAIQGLGGMGKTALACAYAHLCVADYPGGSWQVRCEGQEDLRAVFVSLRGVRDFEFEFTEEEKLSLDLGFERVLRELKKRADSGKPSRVLLILDNVDKPKLLCSEHIKRLPSGDWLHLLVTTRLGESDLGMGADGAFVPIHELSEGEAVGGGRTPDEAGLENR